MLKSKSERPCDCGSGKKFKNCCGCGGRQEMMNIADSRACGECTACCELMGVKELGKPYSVKCQHQCAAGCAIYNSRPPSCHHFSCMWKFVPDFGPELRPDVCGIMLHPDLSLDGKGKAMFVSEVWPNAFQSMPALIDQWLDGFCARFKSQNVSVVYVRHGQQVGTDYPTNDYYKERDTFGHPTPACTTDYVNYVLLTPATPA